MLYLQPYILFFSFSPVFLSLLQTNITLPTTWNQVTRAIFVLGTAANLAILIVHYNTIVHPFTLADNRHYVFYVFRILMKGKETRYLATPVYVTAGYLVIQALGARPTTRFVMGKKGKSAIQPLARGCSSSFALVWLATMALSLVTAPLVEPRYCILPWIMWRLHVPSAAPEDITQNNGSVNGARGSESAGNSSILALLAEMLWFLAIAVGTGYMFLYRGFSWPQEPGKMQRFMW